MSHAYLILCHTPPHHIAILATKHPQHHYYIHYDLKYSISALNHLKNYTNIHILNNRIRINWGGFSMILATLNLFQAALALPQNQYFHLMSGDCVPLMPPEKLSEILHRYPDNSLFLECKNQPHLRYRIRFHAPHADSAWQRHLIGKILTKMMQLADYLIPSQQLVWHGSQWFSASRKALQFLFNEALGEPSDFFSKKLVPDEHFFQYIAQMQPEKLNLINNNHRFIIFQHNSNHPDFLSLEHLRVAKQNGYWFARKVRPQNIAYFLEYEQ